MMVASDFSREDLRIAFTSQGPPINGGSGSGLWYYIFGKGDLLVKTGAPGIFKSSGDQNVKS